MTDKFVGDGRILPYANGGSARTAGQVIVVGNLIGIALNDIAANATGSLALDGVHTVPKASGTAWLQGESLTWDASASAFSTPLALTEATGDVLLAGVAWVAAGSADTTGQIRLDGVSKAIQA